MADAYGGIVGHWRAHVVAWITGEGRDYANIHCEVRFQAVDSWDYASLNGNYGASVAGQTNRGSSSMGISVGVNGEKTLIGKDLRIGKGRGGQNVSFDGYVNITGYASGGSSAGGSIHIGGRPSHTITYNANGGGGAPGNQTKWYGESLFLSNTRPTRALYEFQGWSLTKGSSNVNYRPGQQWFPDENRTLYAVWKLSIVAPRITDVSAYRCNSDGSQNDSGTSAKVSVSWSVDTKADPANKAVSMTILYDGVQYTENISGTSGIYTKVFSGAGSGTTHSFNATLRDTHLTVSASTFLGPVRFLLDISPNGKGMGIGQAAPVSSVAIGGAFFANSLDELPQTASDVGGIGTLATVMGEEYVWNGKKWLTSSPVFTQQVGDYDNLSITAKIVGSGSRMLLIAQIAWVNGRDFHRDVWGAVTLGRITGWRAVRESWGWYFNNSGNLNSQWNCSFTMLDSDIAFRTGGVYDFKANTWHNGGVVAPVVPV